MENKKKHSFFFGCIFFIILFLISKTNSAVLAEDLFNPYQMLVRDDEVTSYRYPNNDDMALDDVKNHPPVKNSVTHNTAKVQTSSSLKTSNSSPNIIVILTDDQPPDTLGIAGNPIIKTPNIDALGTVGGMYFHNAYVAIPLCAPSRASILTGVLPHTHTLTMNGLLLPTNQITLPQILRDNGYDTAMVGKCHIGEPYQLGFNHSVTTDNWPSWTLGNPYSVNRNGVIETQTQYHTYFLTDEAIKYINQEVSQQSTNKKPFFLWLAYNAPHEINNPPLTPDRYSTNQIPKPVSITDDLSTKPIQQSIQMPHQAFNPTNDPAQAKFPWQVGWSFIQERKEKAYEEVSIIDDSVGKIKQQLQSLGVADNTIIVYLSDNGLFYGEHQLTQKASYMYEEITKTPLIISYPKLIKQGGERETLVSTIDITPTLLNMVEINPPLVMQGKSLVPILSGNTTEHRKSIFIEYAGQSTDPNKYYPMRALVMDGYKIAHSIYTGDTKTAPDGTTYAPDGRDYELYNLTKDPYEMTNLMQRSGPSDKPLQRLLVDSIYGQEVRKLIREIAIWQTDTEDPIRRSISDLKNKWLSSDTLEVTWQSPDNLTSEIEYKKQGCLDCESQEVYDFTLTKNHRLLLKGLEPNTNYSLRVFSITENGNGVYSDVESVAPPLTCIPNFTVQLNGCNSLSDYNASPRNPACITNSANLILRINAMNVRSVRIASDPPFNVTCRDQNDDSLYGSSLPYSASFDVSVSAGNGGKRVCVKLIDASNNSLNCGGLIWLDEPILLGDLNEDGKVDLFDFNELISHFGETGTIGWIRADIIKNGVVDLFDFNALVSNYGK